MYLVFLADDEEMSANAESDYGVTPEQQVVEEQIIDPAAAQASDLAAEDTLSMAPAGSEHPEDIFPDVEIHNSVSVSSPTEPSSLPSADVQPELEVPEEAGEAEVAPEEEESRAHEEMFSTVEHLDGNQEQNLEELTEEPEMRQQDGMAEVEADALEACKNESTNDVPGEEAAGEVREAPEVEGAAGPGQTETREQGDGESAEEPYSPRTRSMLKRKAMKRRPCSLPVSELETVIASACAEPETPRSHYIRIHHLLHSLPSAQQRCNSQEDEEALDPESSEDVTLKSTEDKEEEVEENEEGTSEAQSPSIVPECPGPCCRRTLPRSLSIERLSELTQLLDGESLSPPIPRFPDSEDGEMESARGGLRGPRESECELCDTSCYSTSCYSTSCYSTSCYSNSGNEGRNRFCSHTRLSSVDSTRLSESTVFSSQEEEEEENSAFESAPDLQSPEVRDLGDGSPQCRVERAEGGQWSEEQGDQSPVAGPSVRAPGKKEYISRMIYSTGLRVQLAIKLLLE